MTIDLTYLVVIPQQRCFKGYGHILLQFLSKINIPYVWQYIFLYIEYSDKGIKL